MDGRKKIVKEHVRPLAISIRDLHDQTLAIVIFRPFSSLKMRHIIRKLFVRKHCAI